MASRDGSPEPRLGQYSSYSGPDSSTMTWIRGQYSSGTAAYGRRRAELWIFLWFKRIDRGDGGSRRIRFAFEYRR